MKNSSCFLITVVYSIR